MLYWPLEIITREGEYFTSTWSASTPFQVLPTTSTSPCGVTATSDTSCPKKKTAVVCWVRFELYLIVSQSRSLSSNPTEPVT